MPVVTCGTNQDGTPCEFYLDGILKKNMDEVKKRVKDKNWDYCGIVSGLPGAGKSNFAMNTARYCCEWFDEKYIAFTDDEFIKITNEAPEYSAVMLDESFASLNTRISNSSSFLRIINHLQLIRQKHLFIFLCLPNFFDLSKGIALYRASHLFLVYPDSDGGRGRFAAFDRDSKRELYIKGGKYMNYNCVDANFIGRFVRQKSCNEKTYDLRKRKHLLEQEKSISKITKDRLTRNNLIKHIAKNKIMKKAEIVKASGLSRKTIYNILQK